MFYSVPSALEDVIQTVEVGMMQYRRINCAKVIIADLHLQNLLEKLDLKKKYTRVFGQY